MRISDWSSDVCSSDLELSRLEAQGAATPQLDLFVVDPGPAESADAECDTLDSALKSALEAIDPDQLSPREALDILYRLRNEHRSEERRGGKSVSVRVDTGGRGTIKKKTEITTK